MLKDSFIDKRTEIISKMLDNPDTNGIYPTTDCFAELDDMYDEIIGFPQEVSGAQKLRNEGHLILGVETSES